MLGVILNSDYFQDEGAAIGIVLDADANPLAAADKARNYFRDAGLSSSIAHAEVAAGPPRFGFFIVPDGSSMGALEELLLRGVDEGRRVAAEHYIEKISETFGAPKKVQKAVLQAYFAGQVDHVKSIPVAVNKTSVLDNTAPAHTEFQMFLRSLRGS